MASPPAPRPASSIQPETPDWIWEPFIPRGQISRIDGNPGLGKSLIGLDLAARLSHGQSVDGTDLPSGPQSSLILTAEDSLAEVSRRLKAAGADLGRVLLVGSDEVQFPKHNCWLEDEIVSAGFGLVVIDPFISFLPLRLDSHKDQDVRQALRPLKSICENTGAALLLIGHLNKSSGRAAVYRTSGSGGLVNAGRVAMLAVEDRAVPNAGLIVISKSNIGPKRAGWRYVVEAPEGVPVVRWLDTVNVSADEVVDSTPPTKFEIAENMLAELLAKGPVRAAKLKKEALKRGVSWRTVESAKKSLGVVAKSIPSEKSKSGRASTWKLPD